MVSLLLDTHVVLWLAGGSILGSPVSACEIALLADTGRVSLDCPPDAWLERFLSRPGASAVTRTWRAVACYRLARRWCRAPALASA
jgi:PIN domain nuclease of toxin-antitoxin system